MKLSEGFYLVFPYVTVLHFSCPPLHFLVMHFFSIELRSHFNISALSSPTFSSFPAQIIINIEVRRCLAQVGNVIIIEDVEVPSPSFSVLFSEP